MKMTFNLVLLALLAICCVGCSSHEATTDRDWTITIGSGGGITGGSSGYTIDGSGHVKFWRMTTPTAARETTDHPSLRPGDASLFRSYLDQIRFDTMTSRHTGNWTLFVSLSQKGIEQRVLWTPDNPVRPLQSFYDFVLTYVTSREGSK